MSELAPLIRASVERLLAEQVTTALLARAGQGDWPAGLWLLCQDQGLDRVRLTAGAGGTGGDWRDAHGVIRACGAVALPLPVPEALVARWLLELAGMAQPDGVITLLPGPVRPDETGRLTGRLERVPWGRHARWLVGTTAGASARIVLLDGATLAWQPGSNLAGEPRDDAELAGVPASIGPRPVAGGLPAVLGGLVRATQIAGGGATLLAHCLEHASSRQQFGRSLAGFQVIRHNLARLATAAAAAESVTANAWLALDQAPPGRIWHRDGRLLAAAARVTAGELAGRLASIAHQLHGAMGFSHEHRLHYYSRRLWAWRGEFGPTAAWARQLGALALRRGGHRLWADLTAITDREPP